VIVGSDNGGAEMWDVSLLKFPTTKKRSEGDKALDAINNSHVE
jgi:hypothetical protein